MLQNEETGWELVWAKHANWLRTVLRARLRNSLDADEVLQDVAVLAWRKRTQLNDQSRIEPWLYRIAIRQVLMFWRRQKRTSGNVELAEAARHEDKSVPNPADWVFRKEAQDLVRQAMRKLPPRDREILMLKHVESWTYQQISDRLGISYDKVVYRVSRARDQLRKYLVLNEVDP